MSIWSWLMLSEIAGLTRPVFSVLLSSLSSPNPATCNPLIRDKPRAFCMQNVLQHRPTGPNDQEGHNDQATISCYSKLSLEPPTPSYCFFCMLQPPLIYQPSTSLYRLFPSTGLVSSPQPEANLDIFHHDLFVTFSLVSGWHEIKISHKRRWYGSTAEGVGRNNFSPPTYPQMLCWHPQTIPGSQYWMYWATYLINVYIAPSHIAVGSGRFIANKGLLLLNMLPKLHVATWLCNWAHDGSTRQPESAKTAGWLRGEAEAASLHMLRSWWTSWRHKTPISRDTKALACQVNSGVCTNRWRVYICFTWTAAHKASGS